PISTRGPLLCALAIGSVILSGCAATTSGQTKATPAPTTASTPTPTPSSPCVVSVPGTSPITTIGGIPGIQLPAGTYGSAGKQSGGGTGQYSVTTYTLCFPGSEAAIDGGPIPPQGTPTSTVGHLVGAGWMLNNLFPDPTSFAYLDYCSTQHVCVN